MKHKLSEFSIKNYRSISNIKLTCNESNLITICGSNNVGKTNFLRALNLFFNPDIENFDPDEDIPHHIVEGSRGQGYVITLKAKFDEIGTDNTYTITENFTEQKGIKEVRFKGTRNKESLSEKEIRDFLKRSFKFFFVEASNVNIPKLVSEIVNDEILPLGLDKRRGKNQKESLAKLDEFIELSKKSVGKIERELTKIFQSLLKDVESIDSNDWKLQIRFPEYLFLREAISKIIEFTLFDTNERKLETKGSGIQRTILLSLIQYVNSRTKKDIIWAIDEPEAFLQAGLQKSLYSKLISESESSQIIITTHSHFFIDVNDLENTFLFEGTKELKEYTRKKGFLFYKLNTLIFKGSNFEQAQRIKKNFGIGKNDSWEVMPFNILVEGQEDKDLFISLMKKFKLSIPNILVGGGVDKYPGFLQFLNDFCTELEYKPKIIAVFDRDGAGRAKFNQLNNKIYEFIELNCKYIDRFDGEQFNDIELEDFIYPNLFFDAVNKFLRKKKYSQIKKGDRRKRTLPAYNKKPILDLATELCRQNNEDKPEINFNSLNMKLFLSKTICELIDKKDLTGPSNENPRVKLFLKEIVDTCG
ncbi:ATP-dependent nuclease [Psychroflexus montanilacus]|uniref:ATP-dependent nuclease n=1 Tax=Psychroflexus montanilacus TaxID=2873598 RepID=UPI001CCE7EB0|nr:AAA family ATPase [Psychroflexus montanilacus]MBZ9652835.1 ATP-binding protein [Psychroflexus montanilacus]